MELKCGEETLPLGDAEGALVAWSGGRDSTLLLLNLLEKTDKKVRAISVESDQIEACKIQNEYMKELKKIITKRYRKFEWETLKIKSKGGVWARTFGQCLFWVTNLALAARYNEDVYMGYVRGDDVWHIRTEVFSLFNTITTLADKDAKLILPFEWSDKVAVFDGLQAYGLLDKTWYCQGGGPIPCGTCGSCKTDRIYRAAITVSEAKE